MIWTFTDFVYLRDMDKHVNLILIAILSTLMLWGCSSPATKGLPELPFSQEDKEATEGSEFFQRYMAIKDSARIAESRGRHSDAAKYYLELGELQNILGFPEFTYDVYRAAKRNALASGDSTLILLSEIHRVLDLRLVGSGSEIEGRALRELTELRTCPQVQDNPDLLALIDSGLHPSFVTSYRRATALNDSMSMDFIRVRSVILRLELLKLIGDFEYLVAEQKSLRATERSALIGWIVCVALALGLLSFFLWSQKRAETLRRKAQEAEAERKSRDLIIEAMKAKERENALRNLHGQVVKAAGEQDISDSLAASMALSINEVVGSNPEWEILRDALEEQHSGFLETLSAKVPGLTERDKRLCVFLRLGLDNQQICRMLSIQPASLYKARYRLRTKLGLTNDASLNEFIASS